MSKNTYLQLLEENVNTFVEEYKNAYMQLLEHPKPKKPKKKCVTTEILLDNMINYALETNNIELLEELSKELNK